RCRAARGVQERRPVHGEGRRARRNHARRRRGDLGVLADQVPGRHGHFAHVHVRLEHGRCAGADPGLVALSAAHFRDPDTPHRAAHGAATKIVAFQEHRMNPLAIARTPSACDAPLSIGRILAYGIARAPKQEIVYADRTRYTYADLAVRVNRLASALAALGVAPGATVAIMDWDSHRYLECFFAVPMMGAVLHTVNVRISPEQILYTINHAQDDVILVDAEFLPLLEGIRAKIRPGVRFVLIKEATRTPWGGIEFAAEYESMLDAAAPEYRFPALAEDTRATTFYTTGTTGLPKGVYYSHRQLALHTLGASQALAHAPHASFGARDVYMPITPMFHVHAWGLPYVATMLGVKQVYPGRYAPDVLLGLIAREGVTFSHCVPTILQMMLASPALTDGALRGWKVIIGGSALVAARAPRGRGRVRRHRRLRNVGDVPDPHAVAPHAGAARGRARDEPAVPLPGRPRDSIRRAPRRRRGHERRCGRRRAT